MNSYIDLLSNVLKLNVEYGYAIHSISMINKSEFKCYMEIMMLKTLISLQFNFNCNALFYLGAFKRTGYFAGEKKRGSRRQSEKLLDYVTYGHSSRFSAYCYSYRRV